MRDSESVPIHLVSVYGSRVIRLDLSENHLRLWFCFRNLTVLVQFHVLIKS